MDDPKVVLADFDEAMKQDKIAVAFEIIKSLEVRAVDDESVRPLLADYAQKIAVCQMQHMMVRLRLDDMNRDKNWALVSNKRDITVYKRPSQDEDTLIHKSCTFFPMKNKYDVPMEFVKLVSFVAEVDLMSLYFPNKLMHSSEITKQITPFNKYFHMKFHPGALIPVSKRDCFASGHGYDLSESGEVMITFNSLKEGEVDENGISAPEPDGKYQRIDMSGASYFKVTEEGIHYKIMAKVAMRLKLAIVGPNFQEYLTRHLWHDYIVNVRKKYKHFKGSIWETRVKENPDFYNDLRVRVAGAIGLDMERLAAHEAARAAEA